MTGVTGLQQNKNGIKVYNFGLNETAKGVEFIATGQMFGLPFWGRSYCMWQAKLCKPNMGVN